MRIAACLLVLACLAGCANKDKVPSGIIPRDQMSSILWDMIQADQYSEAYLVKDSARINVKMETLKLYQRVFLLHKVSLADFRKSMNFYLEHPDMTRALFDTVISKGNRQRTDSFKGGAQVNPAGAPNHPTTPATNLPGSHGGAVIPPAKRLPFLPGRQLPGHNPKITPDTAHGSSRQKPAKAVLKVQ